MWVPIKSVALNNLNIVAAELEKPPVGYLAAAKVSQRNELAIRLRQMLQPASPTDSLIPKGLP